MGEAGGGCVECFSWLIGAFRPRILRWDFQEIICPGVVVIWILSHTYAEVKAKWYSRGHSQWNGLAKREACVGRLVRLTREHGGMGVSPKLPVGMHIRVFEKEVRGETNRVELIIMFGFDDWGSQICSLSFFGVRRPIILIGDLSCLALPCLSRCT